MKIVSELEAIISFSFVIGLCEVTIVVDIVLSNELVVNLACCIGRDFHLSTLCCFVNMVYKKCGRDDHGATAHQFRNFFLKLLGKLLVALAGNHGEDIDIKDSTA